MLGSLHTEGRFRQGLAPVRGKAWVRWIATRRLAISHRSANARGQWEVKVARPQARARPRIDLTSTTQSAPDQWDA